MISTANDEAALNGSREARRLRFLWGSVAAISFMMVVLIAAAPLIAAQGHPEIANTIYKVFSFLCHQLPERSFHLAGHQFAVCSRCTGIYSGFAVAALGYPLLRSLKRTDTPHLIWLILAIVPLTIDFGLTYFGIWQNNDLTRVSTGALLGVVAVFYVMPGLIELSLWARNTVTKMLEIIR